MGPLPWVHWYRAADEYLYGVTLTGGTGINRACDYFGSGACGTIFKISTIWRIHYSSPIRWKGRSQP